MSSKHLLNLLRLGEGVQVEFKQRMPKLNRMAKTFSAFSNSSGGRVFFGVNDEGHIMPLENADGTVELAQQVAHFYCKPAIEVEAELIEVSPGEHILSVSIEESDEKPIYAVDVNHPKDAWPYFRSDKENLPMDRKSLRTMRKTRSEDLGEAFESLGKHERQMIEHLSRHPRQTLHQLSRGSNIGIQRTKKMMVELEKNGWVYSFFNEKRREFSLAVPWKKRG